MSCHHPQFMRLFFIVIIIILIMYTSWSEKKGPWESFSLTYTLLYTPVSTVSSIVEPALVFLSLFFRFLFVNFLNGDSVLAFIPLLSATHIYQNMRGERRTHTFLCPAIWLCYFFKQNGGHLLFMLATYIHYTCAIFVALLVFSFWLFPDSPLSKFICIKRAAS